MCHQHHLYFDTTLVPHEKNAHQRPAEAPCSQRDINEAVPEHNRARHPIRGRPHLTPRAEPFTQRRAAARLTARQHTGNPRLRSRAAPLPLSLPTTRPQPRSTRTTTTATTYYYSCISYCYGYCCCNCCCYHHDCNNVVEEEEETYMRPDRAHLLQYRSYAPYGVTPSAPSPTSRPCPPPRYRPCAPIRYKPVLPSL